MQKAVAEHGGSFIQKIPEASVQRIVIAEKYEGVLHHSPRSVYLC